MPFNEGKCGVLQIGLANHGYQYTMNSKPITNTQVEKDLWVLVDANATQMLAVICCSLALMDDVTLPLLFKSLVWLHLKFGNLIWVPSNRVDQKSVERVQLCTTRLVSRMKHLSYQERLKSLRLPSLYYWRKRCDMIFIY